MMVTELEDVAKDLRVPPSLIRNAALFRFLRAGKDLQQEIVEAFQHYQTTGDETYGQRQD